MSYKLTLRVSEYSKKNQLRHIRKWKIGVIHVVPLYFSYSQYRIMDVGRLYNSNLLCSVQSKTIQPLLNRSVVLYIVPMLSVVFHALSLSLDPTPKLQFKCRIFLTSHNKSKVTQLSYFHFAKFSICSVWNTIICYVLNPRNSRCSPITPHFECVLTFVQT